MQPRLHLWGNTLSLFHSNVTLLGSAVVKWLQQCKHSIVCLQEHRLSLTQLQGLKASLFHFGWSMHAGAADTTEAGSTSAGTLVAWRSDLDISPSILLPCGQEKVVAGARLTLVQARLKDVYLIIGSAYLVANDGPHG